MNKDAKRISNSWRPQIDIVKGYILSALDRGVYFDADGYVGKTAIKELRQAGFKIKYYRERRSYKGDK
jgi:hypothetical protein